MRSAMLHGAMGRPPKEIRRDRQFNVGLTAREHELLFARAAHAGTRPVDYARARLFGERHGDAPKLGAPAPHLDPLFVAQLSRLGNLLNQITRRLNTLEFPAPPSLEPLLQEIRALIAKAGSP